MHRQSDCFRIGAMIDCGHDTVRASPAGRATGEDIAEAKGALQRHVIARTRFGSFPLATYPSMRDSFGSPEPGDHGS
jgi:hypothetical protein